jgi:hypothetical protein
MYQAVRSLVVAAESDQQRLHGMQRGSQSSPRAYFRIIGIVFSPSGEAGGILTCELLGTRPSLERSMREARPGTDSVRKEYRL